MRKPKPLLALAAAALALALCPLNAFAAETETDPAADPGTAAPESETDPTPAPELAPGGEELVYIGEIATRMEDQWECPATFAVGSTTPKTYETMVGNVVQLTLYSTVPQDDGSAFYLPMDSHITYTDGTDRFTMTGLRGSYYCYQKQVRITAPGDFDLAVANTNGTLYSGLYDTVSFHVYDDIESLSFLAEESAADAATTYFFVTANGSETAVITPDTTGFNATDNEWKIITAEKNERVLFADTEYAGYTFAPGTISLAIHAGETALAEPTAIQVYYLGLFNGKLITVGPYTYPASAATYSSTFTLARTQMDVLATESTLTFYAYIEADRQPGITVTDADGRVSLQSVEKVESDVAGLDKLAVTVTVNDTAQDIDLLVGNRWGANEIAYNYRTLHISFLRQVQNVSLTARQDGHYHVTYSATVNGQQGLDTTAVNWYINGEVQPEHGLSLDRTYGQGGHYTVYAELGGLQSNQIESTIIYTDAQANFWYLAMLLVLLLAGWLLWRRVRTGGARMDDYLRARLKALRAQAMADKDALAQGKASARRTVATVCRRAHTLDRLRDDLLLRYNATNMASYQQADAALSQTVKALRTAARTKADDAYYAHALLDTYLYGLKKAETALTDLSLTAK